MINSIKDLSLTTNNFIKDFYMKSISFWFAPKLIQPIATLT